jgi:thiamine-phosphate pyrophosphorylase
MKLPFKLYLITDRRATKLPLPEAIRQALQGGVRAVQLREKDLPVRELLVLARELRELTREFGSRLFINDRVDVAIGVDADGVHLGHQSMPVEAVRRIVGYRMLIGVSTHTIEEAMDAEKGGADFITFGPVFETPSKVKHGNPVGCDAVSGVKNSISIPLFGLGGIQSGNAGSVLRAGAYGIALISAILRSDNIQKATEDIIRQLDGIRG